jgi:site-specific DNA-methyltransferase (adenine-specific)
MLFRKPLGEKTIAENLRQWKTGGLRRLSLDKPFPEVIPSGRTPRRETAISDHPCLKSPRKQQRPMTRRAKMMEERGWRIRQTTNLSLKPRTLNLER